MDIQLHVIFNYIYFIFSLAVEIFYCARTRSHKKRVKYLVKRNRIKSYINKNVLHEKPNEHIYVTIQCLTLKLYLRRIFSTTFLTDHSILSGKAFGL